MKASIKISKLIFLFCILLFPNLSNGAKPPSCIDIFAQHKLAEIAELDVEFATEMRRLAIRASKAPLENRRTLLKDLAEKMGFAVLEKEINGLALVADNSSEHALTETQPTNLRARYKGRDFLELPPFPLEADVTNLAGRLLGFFTTNVLPDKLKIANKVAREVGELPLLGKVNPVLGINKRLGSQEILFATITSLPPETDPIEYRFGDPSKTHVEVRVGYGGASDIFNQVGLRIFHLSASRNTMRNLYDQVRSLIPKFGHYPLVIEVVEGFRDSKTFELFPLTQQDTNYYVAIINAESISFNELEDAIRRWPPKPPVATTIKKTNSITP